MLQLYLTRVGTPRWEETFGEYWDEPFDRDVTA